MPMQAASSLVALNVVPTTHAVQLRSLVAIPALVCPWPVGQVDQTVQLRSVVVVCGVDA